MDFFRSLSVVEMGVLLALVIAVIIGAAVIFDRLNDDGDQSFETVATSVFRSFTDEEIAQTRTAAAPLLAASQTALIVGTGTPTPAP